MVVAKSRSISLPPGVENSGIPQELVSAASAKAEVSQNDTAALTPTPRTLLPAFPLPATGIASHEIPAVIAPRRKAATGPIADSALATSQEKIESLHPHVLLAPQRVIYPALPDRGNLSPAREILVKAIVNAEGKVSDVQVPGQAPSVAAAVANTVKRWRYRPYVVNGQSLEVETHMVFTVLSEDAMSVRFLPPGANPAR